MEVSKTRQCGLSPTEWNEEADETGIKIISKPFLAPVLGSRQPQTLFSVMNGMIEVCEGGREVHSATLEHKLITAQ